MMYRDPRPVAETPFQLGHLTLDSMLRDLPSHDTRVEPGAPGKQVLGLFEADVHLPGVLVTAGEVLLGVVSRNTFFEKTGRMFGPEVFLSRPVSAMLEMIPLAPLILPETTLITHATQQALCRERDAIYQPIVSAQGDREYRLISALVLFMAQSRQLTLLHEQRLFTVESGLRLSDDQAASRFVIFAGLNGNFDRARCSARHSIRCDRCGQSVVYSIADIVRSYPQLGKGMAIEEAMGARSYRFYVRHRCGSEIWEVPVQHDANMEYRSQRPSRLVESDA